ILEDGSLFYIYLLLLIFCIYNGRIRKSQGNSGEFSWLNIVSYYPFANFSLYLDEIYSITKINIINPIKIEPTSLHRYEFIANINGAPIPPAPTKPKTVASLKFISKRYIVVDKKFVKS